MTKKNARTLGLIATILVALFLLVPATQAQTLPGETPEKFTPTNDGFEYVRR